MKKQFFSLAVLMVGLMMTTSAQSPNLEGVWEGTLSVSGASLRLIFKITKAPDGALTAKLDSPDQGALDLPVDSVNVDGSSVRFEMKRFLSSFEAKINPEFTEMNGNWKQGGLELPLVMKRTEKATKLNRPQEPQKPFPYNDEEVSYENKKAGNKLAGTLTTPRDNKGPFPAVILITGSGAQDRNEEIFGHKPFLVLADHLTRQGVAVLRVDDRGVGGSTGTGATATTEDFADDVLAGVEYLKSRKEIDPKHIGLIGHSEGGIIAPMLATRSGDIAFIVLMAGTGLPGEEIIHLQAELIAKAAGSGEKEIAESRKMQERIFAVIKSEKDPKEAEKKLNALRDEITAGMPEDMKKAGADKALDAQFKSVNSPWFRYFTTYDPRPALTKVKCPVLAINGERDLQVPYKENLGAIEAALKAGGNKDFTIIKLPELNHLFQKAQTGSPSEYGKIEETISPLALQTISDWIKKHVK